MKSIAACTLTVLFSVLIQFWASSASALPAGVYFIRCEAGHRGEVLDMTGQRVMTLSMCEYSWVIKWVWLGVAAPPADPTEGRWILSPLVGITTARLYDESYTTTDVFVSEPDLPAVRLGRERDSDASLEISAGLAIMRPRSRHAVAIGLGTTLGGAPRAYAGYAFRVSDRLMLGTGVAAGPVDRIPTANVGRVVLGSSNLNLPPARVVRFAPFLNVAYRFRGISRVPATSDR